MAAVGLVCGTGEFIDIGTVLVKVASGRCCWPNEMLVDDAKSINAAKPTATLAVAGKKKMDIATS